MSSYYHDVKEEAGDFTNSAIDSNIDESLKQMKAATTHDLADEFEDAAAKAKKAAKLFNEDDALLFSRVAEGLQGANLDRAAQAIAETYFTFQWPRFELVRNLQDLAKKIKTKARAGSSANATPDQPAHTTYEDGWYNEVEQQVKTRLAEMANLPDDAQAANNGSNRRLRYTEPEEVMFRHWMIQGQRRNYIFNAYRKTRSKESIIHKMKSVRKSFSERNTTEGKEHIKLYQENEKGHFDPEVPGYMAKGPIPEEDLNNFQERINELVKTRTLVNIAQPDDDEDDPYRAGRDSTAIDLNLLRNYVLMSQRVLNEFSKVERHVSTADGSWMDASNTVRLAGQLVGNALDLTKHRAGHELDEVISAEDLTALLGPTAGLNDEIMTIVREEGNRKRARR